jgi:hypothetical protein
MESQPLEPLSPAIWFARIDRLLDVANKFEGDSPDVAIRMAYHLVALAPGPIRELFPAVMDEGAMEKLLGSGGYESAVFALVGREVAFKAERTTRSAMVEASLELDPHQIFGTGQHRTFAVAMLKAWAQCLANFGKTARALNQADRDLRKFPDGLPPSSTEH